MVKTKRMELRIEGANENQAEGRQALPVQMVLMFSVVSWNIWGLNRVPKQKEVQDVIRDNSLSICAILESHVDISKLQNVCNKVFFRWTWK